MPNPSRLRAAALTATAVTLSALMAGCGGGSQEDDENLSQQKLSWKECPAPSEAEGGGASPPRCRTATSGSAPP